MRSSTRKSSSSQESASSRLLHPFDPIIDHDSKILILGTFPSIKSFENAFYYGHPQNQFWKLLAQVLNDRTPRSIEEKIAFLRKHKIALWDMVRTCRRRNSLDSSLKDIEVNDIEGLLQEYPNIQAIFFTGRKSEALFKRHFSHLNIPAIYLVSPSPAAVGKTFEQKLKEWSILTEFLR